MAPEPTKESRDPLGKRALFSTAPTGIEPPAPKPRQRPKGVLDVQVHCSSCDVTTTMGAQGFMLQHFPLWAWAPWRKDAHFMRCPACGQLAWHAVSRSR